ncbi:hypothetical protein [Salisediminibacterium beveridgei]|uniref:Uncharacterized protein n=1 Tax=Salisediminibacterium beveridgei TaxID=632773 RepID=A0A1D7QRH2_9BACI|nr:hypothetical protein [Salisediminibacterium beveridgei]AOM81603.1 hypothetical protein BBEV_0208 [Salisediminibacterium beveridgei]
MYKKEDEIQAFHSVECSAGGQSGWENRLDHRENRMDGSGGPLRIDLMRERRRLKSNTHAMARKATTNVR